MSQIFSEEAVAAHNNADDLWIIIDGDVYDLTEFQNQHPGGKRILARFAGKDASKPFAKYHSPGVLKSWGPKLKIGSLDTKAKASVALPPPEPVPAKQQPNPAKAGNAVASRSAEPLGAFGDLVPFADPSWYHDYRSPYHNESHAALRNEVREWVESRIEPFMNNWDAEKKIPEDLYREMGRRGYLAGLLGLKVDPSLCRYNVKSVPWEKWDAFHEGIVVDEICRAGSGGLIYNLVGGYAIGCPPVALYGSPNLQRRILPGLLAGEKRICLAITEPDAGSDVSSLTCEAKLSPDKTHYIVNGEKKWITNGVYADYFTTAVRTGGPGRHGLSMLLIERGPGVTNRPMECQGVWGSGTTYVTFEDVKVPVENVLGGENKGMKVIMMNFNHERMGIIIQCIRFARVCYEESVKYAHKRETFGKKLIDHPVIRMKLAHMARQIEASYNWLENLTYQANNMPHDEASLRLGGAIAGCKAQSTTTFEFCAREASQIFGGLSYTRGGQGAKIERLYRDVRAYAIPGGSEEIMLDLSMRQSLKVHQVLGMKL